jgi:hypothetical protein
VDIDFIEVILKRDSILKALSSKIGLYSEGIDEQ